MNIFLLNRETASWCSFSILIYTRVSVFWSYMFITNMFILKMNKFILRKGSLFIIFLRRSLLINMLLCKISTTILLWAWHWFCHLETIIHSDHLSMCSACAFFAILQRWTDYLFSFSKNFRYNIKTNFCSYTQSISVNIIVLPI